MLLELKNIKKYFPVKKRFLNAGKDYVRAVDDVSLTVNKGENLSLVGESGSGKTTLGRVILKLIAPDAGQIIFEGNDISRLSSSQMRPYRQDIQMVFQDPYSSLDPRFTVRRIILESMTFDTKSTVQQKLQKAEGLLSAVQLPKDILNRFPHEFSGGERQRIAIARALAMNPKLLILDEAVSSLDVLVQEEILRILADVQEKFDITLVFISHNLRVVKKVSQKIAVMYKGRVVELGSSEEIFNNPLHPYTQELLAAAIDYKAKKEKFDEDFRDGVRLEDKGNGHFVLM